MHTRGEGDPRAPQRQSLRCVECGFRCDTGNEMARHMYSTRHGARKCPSCDTYIVPRGFFASLRKHIDRQRERERAAAAVTGGAGSGPAVPSLSSLATAASEVGPLTSVATITHAHCASIPGFRCYEKADFEVHESVSHLGGSMQGTETCGELVTTAGSESGSRPRPPFRCMECLNPCDTWTKATKHMDKSGHTLPYCVQCTTRLRCFGPQRPMKHEENTGHRGYYGIFYTRQDYMSASQEPRTAYNYGNSYTGLSTLQYKCVCGISFLHPVHLAEHLRRVHHVECILDEAVCRHCGLHTSLANMMEHLQNPCWEVPKPAPNTESSFTVTETSASSPMLSTVRSPTLTSPKSPPEPLQEADEAAGAEAEIENPDAAATHLIEVVGFSGAPFLQWRPILPPMSEEDVRLMDEAYVMSGNIERYNTGDAKSAAGLQLVVPGPGTGQTDASRKPSYVVLYQCRECLFIFSTWEKMVNHIQFTGHCSTYCCECNMDLPQLLSHQTTYEGNSAPRSSGHHVSFAGGPPTPVRSTTLSDHLKHLCEHGDIIGFPTSPSSLEVLVDVGAACYSGSLDPLPEVFTGDKVVMAYQCPGEKAGCIKVFLNYGSLIEHLKATGHGMVPTPDGATSSGAAAHRLTSCYPMVAYRAKFTTEQLCCLFGFEMCSHCFSAVPAEELELHEALCVARRKKERQISADSSRALGAPRAPVLAICDRDDEATLLRTDPELPGSRSPRYL